jgi:hypothetical protein
VEALGELKCSTTDAPFVKLQRSSGHDSGTMKKLRVELTKCPDGAVILQCVRSDGSITWQKQPAKQARFFALHDLTHFAVESVLGAAHGFYGLIAAGWDITDTTGKGAKGRLPDEAAVIEHLVGMLDNERASGTTLTAVELNDYALAFAAKAGIKNNFSLTDVELATIRSRAADLHRRWMTLPAGSKMVVEFPSG